MCIPTIHIPMQNWSRMLHFFVPNSFKESYHPNLRVCHAIPRAAVPRAQLSRAALLSPSRLTQMESFSFWFCSLAPSAPKMKASPLELPAMRPVRGVDKVSIKFFQQPIKRYRAKAIPRVEKTLLLLLLENDTTAALSSVVKSQVTFVLCTLNYQFTCIMYWHTFFLNCYSIQFIWICFCYITTNCW